jgi:tetraprenyl-beta-curcumene synthase
MQHQRRARPLQRPGVLRPQRRRPVVPAQAPARQRVAHWETRAQNIPDAELRKQALASIHSKKFHCQGGAVFSCADRKKWKLLIEWIVAFQTISDYLDNLCDRSTSLDANDFRSLHQSMLDAVDSKHPTHQYYAYRAENDDGGYLLQLVQTCQRIQRELPSYNMVEQAIRQLVQFYCDLQVYKHIRSDLREQALLDWWHTHADQFPQLKWQEFAAATGSTLGVFYLLSSAVKPNLSIQQVKQISEAYFPAICGLHILLDYFIDQEEDQGGGDLNFCSYYSSHDEMVERMHSIIAAARVAAKSLPSARFHEMIIDGLLALYLSDPKLDGNVQLRQISRRLLAGGSFSRSFFYWNTWIVRRLF